MHHGRWLVMIFQERGECVCVCGEVCARLLVEYPTIIEQLQGAKGSTITEKNVP
jgi:hypothetical protein